MLRPGLRRRSLDFCRLLPEKQLKGKDDECKNEQEDADPVDAMHVFHEKGFGTVGVRFPEIKVLGYLLEDSHRNYIEGSRKTKR
jgi:hypothetical protein